MAKVYLGLGTNMGDKEANLRTAVRLINDRIGKVTSLSSFYRTAPWGFVSDNDFLNAAACSETLLDPLEVLMGKRSFVMDPLAEIAGEVVHPVSGLTMEEMRKRLAQFI